MCIRDSAYTYAGLVLFLTGVNVGFMPAGNYLGQVLAKSAHPLFLVPIAMIMGCLLYTSWLMNLNYIDFLREIGPHFSVNNMLRAECYKQRMEKGLSFLEFNYMLMQLSLIHI